MQRACRSSLAIAALVAALACCSSGADDTGTPGGGGGGGFPDGGGSGGGGDVDASPTPTEITAHIDDSCSLAVFAGYQVTIEEAASTCTTRYQGDGDIIQFTVGETRGEPLPSGRSYTIVPQVGGAYPADGEAHAVISGANSQIIASGTLTIGGDGNGDFVGSYDIATDSGNRSDTFLSDRCPLDPADCE